MSSKVLVYTENPHMKGCGTLELFEREDDGTERLDTRFTPKMGPSNAFPESQIPQIVHFWYRGEEIEVVKRRATQ